MAEACPRCGGEGFILEERDGALRAVPCPCREQERSRRRFARAGIPRRYRHCTLDAYAPQPGNPSQARALQAARRFVEVFPGPQPGLLFLGPCGTGKTHLAVGILHACLAKGGRGMFADLNQVYRRVRATYDHAGEGEAEVLDPLASTPLLVLDEVGCRDSAWAQETLLYLLTRRYNDELPTLLTSNYLDAPPRGEPSLRDRVGTRSRSRLFEMCRCILLEGEDFRERVKRGDNQPV